MPSIAIPLRYTYLYNQTQGFDKLKDQFHRYDSLYPPPLYGITYVKVEVCLELRFIPAELVQV